MRIKSVYLGFLKATTLGILLSLVSGCGINLMPTDDPWYMKHYIIMQDFEREAYKDLSDEGKSIFQSLFWEARSPQSRRIFQERLQSVAERFKSENSRTPWNTDRGRIFLLNGNPSKRDTLHGSATLALDRSGEDVQTHRIELWTYQREQGLVQYAFSFRSPKQWNLSRGEFGGTHDTGNFENTSRSDYYGITDVESYKKDLANLSTAK